MTYEQIAPLLDKYWDGESTLEEERLLKQYFNGPSVDPRLESVAPLFRALKAEQTLQSQASPAPQIVVHSHHRQRYQWAAAASVALLLSAGGWWWWHQGPAGQTYAANTPRPEVHTPLPPAASQEVQAVQAPTIAEKAPKTPEKPTKGLRKWLKKRQRVQEISDEEAAIRELKTALALLSSKLNKGRKEASKNINQLEHIDILVKKKKEING
jgi:hypothetical protein